MRTNRALPKCMQGKQEPQKPKSLSAHENRRLVHPPYPGPLAAGRGSGVTGGGKRRRCRRMSAGDGALCSRSEQEALGAVEGCHGACPSVHPPKALLVQIPSGHIAGCRSRLACRVLAPVPRGTLGSRCGRARIYTVVLGCFPDDCPRLRSLPLPFST